MNLIVITDEKNGMAFNNRRQSRDSVLCRYILGLTDRNIYMSEYSSKLFSKYGNNISVTEDFSVLEKGDFALTETFLPQLPADALENIYLFRWNRHYPADIFFDTDMTKLTLISSSELKGSSHSCITCEVYKV